jgi:hypothetical protein
MMAELVFEVSGAAVDRYYANIIDGFIIDESDPIPEPVLGIEFFRAATLVMHDDDRARLANSTLRVADALAGIAPAPMAGVS